MPEIVKPPDIFPNPFNTSTYGEDLFGFYTIVRFRNISQKMRWIPPTSSQEERAILPGFWMSETPCTQEFWKSIMGRNPSYFKNLSAPVECVSWLEIQEFNTILSRLSGVTFALPTENQWERAYRPVADRMSPIEDYAWFKENSRGKTHSVGEKKSNAFGLKDILGNVWELCSNSISTDSMPLRGGSWCSLGDEKRSAKVNEKSNAIGFRFICQDWSFVNV